MDNPAPAPSWGHLAADVACLLPAEVLFALSEPFDWLRQGCVWVGNAEPWATPQDLVDQLVRLERWKPGEPLPLSRWDRAWTWLGDVLALPGDLLCRLACRLWLLRYTSSRISIRAT